MTNKNLTEKALKKRTLHSGKAVNFRVDTVELPDGKKATREFMDHPGAVAVLPVLEDGSVILVRQYRHPVGEITLEVPAGKLLRPGDDPARRARAELREETGYAADSMRRIMSFWPTPAFSNEVLHVFLARGLRPGPPAPDEDEFIRTVRMPFGRAWELFRKGKIKDAKTILALQAFRISGAGRRNR